VATAHYRSFGATHAIDLPHTGLPVRIPVGFYVLEFHAALAEMGGAEREARYTQVGYLLRSPNVRRRLVIRVAGCRGS